ncbi:hypothetical protein Bca4012_025955 [Brassica carinata]
MKTKTTMIEKEISRQAFKTKSLKERLEELEERERKIALSMSKCKETAGDLSKRLQKLTAKENVSL